MAGTKPAADERNKTASIQLCKGTVPTLLRRRIPWQPRLSSANAFRADPDAPVRGPRAAARARRLRSRIPRAPARSRHGPGRRPSARPVRPAHGLGQERGVLPRHRAAAPAWRRADRAHQPAARAHAKPDRGRAAARHPRGDGQLDQPRRLGRGARPPRRRRGRPPAHQPRAAQQPAVPRRDAAPVHRARGPAGRRRGALRLGLGPRLPPRLPAHPRRPGAAAVRRRGARHHGDGQRPRRRRRQRAVQNRRGRGGPDGLPRAARARFAAPRGRHPAGAGRAAGGARGPAERLAWLATWLPQLPGSGIVYCLTKRDTETVAEWLRSRDIGAIAYSGEVSDEDRVEAEDRLLRNDVKAVVATSALGMGYDKPDLGFVVHYQAPASAIAYYQQVGRAGRGVDEAQVVLLRGHEDRRIQDFFIETAFPPRALVEQVLGALPATITGIQAEVNLGKTRIEALLKVLDVEGAVRREGSQWALTGEPWVYDEERYAQVTALRRAEQAAMFAYGEDGRCLMQALQAELDDPAAEPCGRCSVCAAPRFDAPVDPALARAAHALVRSQPVVLTVRRQTPKTADAPGQRIAPEVLLEEGRALARAGDGGWDPLVQRGRHEGRFDDELVQACVELLARWRPAPPPEWVTAVPSRRSGALVPDFARRLAAALGLPYVEALERTGDNPPQREMANSAQQVANVRGQFRVVEQPPGAPGLL